MEFTLLIDGRPMYTGAFSECITRAYYCHNSGCIVYADTYELVMFFRYAVFSDGYVCVCMSPIEKPTEISDGL